MCALYRDIPIPPRATASSRSFPPPDGFSLRLRFDGEELILSPALSSTDEVPLYEGRGRFRFENTPDGFTVSALSLLDPFLWQHRSVPPRSFKIVLRVILPKLIHEGVPVTCDLSLSDHPPVKIEVRPIQSDGSAQIRAQWAVPRDRLQALPGLDEYVVGGDTLYRASMSQLRELPHLPDDWQPLSGDALRTLGRLCDRMGIFFDGDGVTALRALGRGLPLRTAPTPTMPLRERPAKPIASPQAASDDLTNPFTGKPLSAPAPSDGVADPFADFRLPEENRFVPTSEQLLELSGPTLISAELFAASRQPTSKHAFFFNEARTLKDLRGSPAPHVAFTCYWPTYSSMNRAQKAWYFHWRGQFLDGNVLKTDLAYIFVAVYELINNTVAEPPEALERLLRLWESYRDTFPYLDRVMPTWCMDYILLNRLPPDFDALHERIPFPIDGQTHLIEVFCSRRMQEGLHTLPLSALCVLSGYAMDKSRFYTGHESLCQDAVRTALLTAQKELERSTGKDVFTFFRPPPRSIQWETFRGAVCSNTIGRRVKLTYLPYAQNEALREWLANILRCTENLLRKAHRFPGRLRCTDMPEGLESAIVRALKLDTAPPKAEKAADEVPFAPSAPREPIRIDLERARALESASWDNTRRLLEALGDLPEEEEVPELPQPPDIPPQPVPAEPEVPITAPDASDPYASLLRALSPLQEQVLRALLDEDDAQASGLCTAEMTFPDAVAEEINELAADFLGDLLIDSAVLRVYEDYAPSLLERMN